MLNWCAYCQEFQGERPPYHDLRVTHGICPACALRFDQFTEDDQQHSMLLKNLYARLWDAGLHSDVETAARIVEEASTQRVRSVDVLLGLMAPMLYEIGAQWERAMISVADEHRFTTFCEDLFRIVTERLAPSLAARRSSGARDDVLLLNAAGNQHTLAVRILALWMAHHGVRTWSVSTDQTPDETVAMVRNLRPRLVLVSMSLAEQRPSVATLAAALGELPSEIRPRVIVGGYAVKMGLVEPIAGAELFADISELHMEPREMNSP